MEIEEPNSITIHNNSDAYSQIQLDPINNQFELPTNLFASNPYIYYSEVNPQIQHHPISLGDNKTTFDELYENWLKKKGFPNNLLNDLPDFKK